MELKDLTQDVPTGKKSTKHAEVIKTLYNDLKKHYLKYHRDWYINERFTRGEHWIVYNKTLNKIQNIPTAKGEVRRTINKIRTQVRGVKNFIKRSQPRWQTSPEDSSDESLQEAIKYNKILQNVYDTRNFRQLLTDQIVNSLKYSVGVIEGGIVKKDGKQYLDFWVDDTFDIFVDPMATSKKDARFILKAFKKPVSAIKANKKYNYQGTLKGDSREGASEYKDALEKEKFLEGTGASSKDLDTVIIQELWYKYTENEKTVIRKFTVVDNQIVLVEDTPYSEFPMFFFTPESQSGQLYGDAWIKDLISVNKSLDKVTSQIESYIQRMLAGKFLIKQGVDVSTITDKGSEKIYYKGQVPPRQLDLQPLPNIAMQYAQSLERWIEEFGGIREASLGRSPGSLQSGRGLEALQSADAQTVAEPIENLEGMLKEIGEFIIETISNTTISKQRIVDGKEEIKYIGDFDFSKEQKKTDKDLIIVKPKSVSVKIVPEISYTEQSKQETVMKLAEAGLIDQQTLLDYLNVSNVGDIIERTRKNKEEEYKQEMVKQKESHRTEGESPEDSASLADQENIKMAAGQEVALTPQALWMPEHTELHNAFIEENVDAYQNNKEAFDAHIENEMGYNQQ